MSQIQPQQNIIIPSNKNSTEKPKDLNKNNNNLNQLIKPQYIQPNINNTTINNQNYQMIFPYQIASSSFPYQSYQVLSHGFLNNQNLAQNGQIIYSQNNNYNNQINTQSQSVNINNNLLNNNQINNEEQEKKNKEDSKFISNNFKSNIKKKIKFISKKCQGHRRSKYDKGELKYICTCGKTFVTQLGLSYHIRSKHPEIIMPPKSRRGRKRKYGMNDYENSKYIAFFHAPKRKIGLGEKLNIPNICESVFNFIYKGNYQDKLFSHPNNISQNYVLDKLITDWKFHVYKETIKLTCDEVFFDYLYKAKDKVNEKYFTLLLKFIILLKECYDVHKNKFLPLDYKQQFTDKNSPQDIPELCNEFYGEFLGQNNFFGIEDNNDRLEIIEMIQHFAMWLLKNHYTKSRLGLASNVNYY